VCVAGAQRSDARRGVPGHDAGDKVLSGRISRGVTERINAVIWYSDLAAVAPEPERSALVSVGRYALRGVGRAQEFVTPEPGAWVIPLLRFQYANVRFAPETTLSS